MMDFSAWVGLLGISQAATGSLVAAVWQGILLAVAAWLGLRLLPKTPAAVRFAIWFGVFLVVTALPVVSLWPRAAVAAQTGGHSVWLTLDSRWCLAIAAVWAVASLVRAGTLVVAALRVRELWKRAKSVELEGASSLHPTHGNETAMDGAPGQGWAERTGHRRAQLCVSDEVDRPTVIGFFAPKILIPEWLLEKLTPAELEQVVLHESGHLRRADDWMNLLQKIALVIFPLNPALAWVERRLCFERELACDERVLHATGAPKAYAACLATLAEYRLQRRGGLTLALGALGRESELGRRVGRILRREERMKPLHARLVLGGAMVVLLGAATGLERCPQVVGFAPMQEREVANAAREVRAAAFSRDPYQAVAVRADMGHSGQGKEVAQAVPGKTQESNGMQANADVPHETILKASMPDGRGSAAAEAVGAVRKTTNDTGRQPARVVRAVAEGRKVSRSVDAPSSEEVVITQWVVVTSWQSSDGARMVRTIAGGSDGTQGAGPAMQSWPSEEVYPYAAVPVRGGWLVFQL
jgi:beta-lactamase regulating signal transducer with metallopeptidase domain